MSKSKILAFIGAVALMTTVAHTASAQQAASTATASVVAAPTYSAMAQYSSGVPLDAAGLSFILIEVRCNLEDQTLQTVPKCQPAGPVAVKVTAAAQRALGLVSPYIARGVLRPRFNMTSGARLTIPLNVKARLVADLKRAKTLHRGAEFPLTVAGRFYVGLTSPVVQIISAPLTIAIGNVNGPRRVYAFTSNWTGWRPGMPM
ncbi:MAG: hypothetical protein QOG99_2479 [Frankiales bacterium]|jgi:hypothetical protein|nr:hypothetical protein [Frankiales bacterium]